MGIEDSFWNNEEGDAYDEKIYKSTMFLCICLLAAACGEKENVYFQSETSVAETQRSEAVPETDDTQISEENGIQTEKCFVYICGAVNTPGVYEVTQNARLYEVIEAVSGLTEDAAESLSIRRGDRGRRDGTHSDAGGSC